MISLELAEARWQHLLSRRLEAVIIVMTKQEEKWKRYDSWELVEMMIEYATLRAKIDWQSTRVLLNTYNQIKLRMKEQEVEAVSPFKKPIILCSVAGPVCVLSHFSCVQLFVTLWIVNCWAPLSMRCSRQEYWSERPFSLLVNLPDPGIEPTSLTFPALAGRFLTASATWEALAGPEFSHFWYDDWRSSWIPGRKEPTTA